RKFEKPHGLSANAARTARIATNLFAVVLAVAVGCLTVGGLDVVYSENRDWILLALRQTIVAFFVIAFPPLYLATVMRRRSRLDAAGLVKHLVPSFAAENARADSLQETARKLDDHALLWSCFLPDHKTKARAA